MKGETNWQSNRLGCSYRRVCDAVSNGLEDVRELIHENLLCGYSICLGDMVLVEVRQRPNDHVIEVYPKFGNNLARYLRAICDSNSDEPVVLNGGYCATALGCIDIDGRVWFNYKEKTPSLDDMVLVETERGERFLAVYSGTHFEADFFADRRSMIYKFHPHDFAVKLQKIVKWSWIA